MTRFNLAVTILAASVALNNAFVPSVSTSRPRSFAFSVQSYLDSLTSQPNDDRSSNINNQQISVEPVVPEVTVVVADIAPVAEVQTTLVEKEAKVERTEETTTSSNSEVNVVVADIAPVAEVETTLVEKEANVERTAETMTSSNSALDGVEADTTPAREQSPDEIISLTVESVAKSTLGIRTMRNYSSSKQTLRDSKAKNEKRLSRCNYEKGKTADKIAGIKSQMEQLLKDAANDLEDKLNDIQANFDDEMTLITNLLASQVKIEAGREESIISLISALEGAIKRKTGEIETEENITGDMVVVRSKLKTGNISNQLDQLIEQKRAAAVFDQAQLSDLKDFAMAAETVLQDTKARAIKIQQALANITAVDVTQAGNVQYDFEELSALESTWDAAAKSSDAENKKLAALRVKFDDELLNKVLLLGEEVPEYLRAVANGMAIKKVGMEQVQERQRSMAANADKLESAIRSAPEADDMNAKDDYELLGIVAKSLSNAAIDSAKAGVFGMKAVYDTVNDKGVAEQLKTSTSSKELKEDSLKAFSKATNTIASNVGKTASASQANDALKEGANDLGSAFKAFAALGKKNLDRIKKSDAGK